MADILITDVHPAVLRDLEARARTRGVTVEAIARERLVEGVARWRQDLGEQAREIRACGRRHEGDSTGFIREHRDSDSPHR